jgi:hypothetical protein
MISTNADSASFDSAYKDFHNNDSQRRLVIPDPVLGNWRTPAGFMGYAVNMIDLDTHHLRTRTKHGDGLRQTVLFSLFKRLQVYETRESMMAALPCIGEDGAVSLDGGIIRENGILSLGHGYLSILLSFSVCQHVMTSSLCIFSLNFAWISLNLA